MNPVWMPLHEALKRAGSFEALLPPMHEAASRGARSRARFAGPPRGHERRPRSRRWWATAHKRPHAGSAHIQTGPAAVLLCHRGALSPYYSHDDLRTKPGWNPRTTKSAPAPAWLATRPSIPAGVSDPLAAILGPGALAPGTAAGSLFASGDQSNSTTRRRGAVAADAGARDPATPGRTVPACRQLSPCSGRCKKREWAQFHASAALMEEWLTRTNRGRLNPEAFTGDSEEPHLTGVSRRIRSGRSGRQVADIFCKFCAHVPCRIVCDRSEKCHPLTRAPRRHSCRAHAL